MAYQMAPIPMILSYIDLLLSKTLLTAIRRANMTIRLHISHKAAHLVRFLCDDFLRNKELATMYEDL